MNIKLFFIGFFVMALISCKEAEQTKTVKYYKENEQERITKIEECNDDPGGVGKSKNCINAKQAEMEMRKGDPNRYRL